MATYNDIKKIKIGDNTFVFHVPTASETGALASNTTYVSTITTTAGAHTAISNKSGAVSFNVPTTAAHVGAASSSHTHGNITNGGDITATAPTIASGDQIIINDNSASKITNGPTFDGSTTTTALTPKGTWETFAKTNTNTTYALSGALSSHKFTSTLTAGGSGSGTSTSDFTLAAGNGITITDDATARKMTIASKLSNLKDGSETGAVEALNATAAKVNQLVIGQYNIEDTGTDKDLSNFAFIIGNGTDANTRSNLFTINQSGLVSTHIVPTEDYHWDLSIVDDAPPTPPGNRVGDQYFTGFEIRDAANNRVTHLDTHMTADGELRAVLGVERPIVPNWPDPTKTTASNQIYLGLDANGNRTCMVDAPVAFRHALDIYDHVFEQGTSGIWTYRKWDSGIAECWALTSSANYAVTNPYVNGYYANLSTTSFPSGLFVAAPCVQATRTNTGSGSALIFLSLHTVTASSFTGYVSATSSGTYPCQFSYHAIGRWKNS